MGGTVPLGLGKEELRQYLNWDLSDDITKRVRTEAIKVEFTRTFHIQDQQFPKVATIITFLGLLIALGSKGAMIVTACVAAVIALWAQSPRIKVLFGFKNRKRVADRMLELFTEFDLFYYYYAWLERAEDTNNVIETLVVFATAAVIVAIIVALSILL